MRRQLYIDEVQQMLVGYETNLFTQSKVRHSFQHYLESAFMWSGPGNDTLKVDCFFMKPDGTTGSHDPKTSMGFDEDVSRFAVISILDYRVFVMLNNVGVVNIRVQQKVGLMPNYENLYHLWMFLNWILMTDEDIFIPAECKLDDRATYSVRDYGDIVRIAAHLEAAGYDIEYAQLPKQEGRTFPCYLIHIPLTGGRLLTIPYRRD